MAQSKQDSSSEKSVNINVASPSQQLLSSSEKIQYDEQGYTLRKPPDFVSGIPEKLNIVTWLVIFSSFLERFAFFGSSVMFTTFMLSVLQVEKARSVTINQAFYFAVYGFTLLGGYLSDQFLGKYKTILIFSLWYFFGMALLSISAITSFSSSLGLALFLISLFVFISIGSGGMKASLSSFIIDQLQKGFKPSSSPGIYFDSRLTIERCYRYFYWAINAAALLSIIICPEVATHSYVGSYSISAALLCIFLVVFFVSDSRFNHQKPHGSIFKKVYSCMKYARKHKSPSNKNWLDASKGIDSPEWDDNFVDGLQRSIKACKVFLFYPFFSALFFNLTDNFINQGLQMSRPRWVQPSQLTAVHCLVVVILIPIFDSVIFPFFKKKHISMGPIKRITIGFVVLIITFIGLTILQHFIYKSPPYYDFTAKDIPANAYNNISIMWQIPIYIVISISEIFASITGLEYAYSQAPAELKSFLQAIFQFTSALGSLIGIFLSIWSYDPVIIWSFTAQTIAFSIITVVFWFCFKHYDAQIDSQESYAG
ncbi:hypothetical protein BB560_003441 [Smittium megazygosporum]|uniref:Major facilitator superfamily (MFS) profile domain-containing protein n=1 Tax=Smittium megazygosporum TaxID=133381 RepID=A0A2T9ZC13_9FUNG|nr:hypothetical protein BB560_003441 [Smittium megazygosporum]